MSPFLTSMTFEVLMYGAVWIYAILIPLALFMIYDFGATPHHVPTTNTQAVNPRNGADSSPTSALPEHQQSRQSNRDRRLDSSTSGGPILEPYETRNPAGPEFRRARAITTHIDHLMAQRQSQAVFDDNSDFDFHPSDEEEDWEEQGQRDKAPYPSSSWADQDCNRHEYRSHNSEDTAVPCLDGAFPSGSLVAPASDATEDDKNDHPRVTPVSRSTAVTEPVSVQLDREAFAKAAANTATAANTEAKEEKVLPGKPTPPLAKRGAQPSPLVADIGKSRLDHRPLDRQASIDAHIDTMMHQQGLQQIKWAHADMPFERSAGEHRLQEGECHASAECEDFDDEDPEVDLDSGSEQGDVYSYQHASHINTHDSSPVPAPKISSGAALPSRNEATQDAESYTILPYAHRYDTERTLLASSMPASASYSAGPQQPQTHLPSLTPRSPTTSTTVPFCVKDPVFGNREIEPTSPSVQRQVEMRAGKISSQLDEDGSEEQDWSDDEYRYGDVAGDDGDGYWSSEGPSEG